MSRVERSTDQQLNAFSLFETAIALDQQVRDRTQQLKQVLQSLEKTNGRLLQAKQQAEAASSLKSSVLVSVTHDLLQPLNAARLTLSALTEMVNQPKGVALAEQIDRSLATLEDMLRTLLDISKLDAGVLKPEFESDRARLAVRTAGAGIQPDCRETQPHAQNRAVVERGALGSTDAAPDPAEPFGQCVALYAAWHCADGMP